MTDLQEFKIIPILGRKTNVAQGDYSLFKLIGDNVALTHDVGGLNFDMDRKKNTCTKSYGSSTWSNSATAQATKCLGLFELYDGTNRDHIFFDNGKFYVYDASLDPIDKTAAGVTHATDNVDLYSIIRVGSHMVFADRAEHTPYAWKNGDANAAKLISSGTEYKFRYLVYFMNRIVGLYSDQTNGDIDIRWSGALPTPTSSCTFGASNQLWVPNDDSIVGGKMMGMNRCYIYSENSIHNLAYYPDFASPFRAYTVVPKQGSVNHHSIVNLGYAHAMFNKNYGFCMYDGGNKVTPISNDVEIDIQDINSAYYNLIVGTFVPLTRNIVWTVPMSSEATPTHLMFYNIDTKQWRIEDKAMRYVDNWSTYQNYTWNDFITDLGGAGATWTTGTNTWAYYTSERQRLAYANTDGKLYYRASEGLSGSALYGRRIEPIMDFGDRNRRDLLLEIWFDLSETEGTNISLYYRGGNTVGEVEDASWIGKSSAGGGSWNPWTVSHNAPEKPIINLSQNYKLHQIKWGVNSATDKFAVGGITFRFAPGSRF